jgi:hypothetical protein
MTEAQFLALAELLQARRGPARVAAFLVLVDGIRPSVAARQTGISPASVSNAVTRFKKGQALARLAS